MNVLYFEPLQIKVFSNQNMGHSGSRYIFLHMKTIDIHKSNN